MTARRRSLSKLGGSKANTRFSMPKINVVQFIFDNLNDLHFGGGLEEPAFQWLSPVSFRRSSWVDADTIHLHPKLVVPEWKELLEFEIHKSMLTLHHARLGKGVHSLEFRRGEARVGDLQGRLRRHREFLTLLFKKHAKKLKLPRPHPTTLFLFVCKVCGSGASRLSEERAVCEYCKLKLPVQMRMWDQVDIMQHYKFSLSPADFMISEQGKNKVYLFEDSFLRHFVS